MISWCTGSPTNSQALSTFARELVSQLNTCFPISSNVSWKPHTIREHMWSRYHRVRTSPVFTKRWTEFIHLSTSQEQLAPPVLFQYVTDIVFKNLIETTFPSKVTKTNQSAPAISTEEEKVVRTTFPSKVTRTNQSAPAISTEEEKVIRYAAGYTLRTLKRKLQGSSNPLKKHMIATITDLVGDELNDYALVGRALEAYGSRRVCVSVCLLCAFLCSGEKLSAKNYNASVTRQYLRSLFCKF